MKATRYKIDSYSIQIFAQDRKGARTRWGDRVICLYSEGREVAQAVFAREGSKAPEPYLSGGKIYFFAPGRQYEAVVNLLRHEGPVYIAWEPVSDPKERHDGDAYFYTENSRLEGKG